MAKTRHVEKDRTFVVPVAAAELFVRKWRGARWKAWPFAWFVALVSARSPSGVTTTRPSNERFAVVKPW
jgi:hypothetical protein